MHHTMRSSESGNVFFYIFLGVALFAGLSYAVSQSGRGSVDSITREQARLHATEIIDFGDTVARAVGAMRLRGVSLSQLRFAHDALPESDYGDPDSIDPTHMVFNAAGGGVIFKDPGPDITRAQNGQWMFVTGNQVTGFGTSCAVAGCSDLLMVLADIRNDICTAINRLGGVDEAATLPAVTAFNTEEKFQGSLPDTPYTIGTGDSAVLDGKASGCFRNSDDGRNYFYQMLWAQ